MSLKNRIPPRTSHKFLLLTAAFMLSTAAQLFGQLETGKISGHRPRYIRCGHSRSHSDGKERGYGSGAIGAIRKHRAIPDPRPYSGDL